MGESKPFYQRLDDDEWFDEIVFTTVPRFKTSGLSGDEWRHSIHVQLKRKGIVLHEYSRNRMEWAVAHLVWEMASYSDNGVPAEQLQLLEPLCLQPGCAELAAVEYRKVKDGCGRCGSQRNTPGGPFGDYRRHFCARHARRGDSDLDDSDDNYELLAGEPRPEPRDESESAFGGIIGFGPERDG